MPWSALEGKEWACNRAVRALGFHRPAVVVDIGAGGGSWREVLGSKLLKSYWIAYEAWEPTIIRYDLDDRYDTVVTGDVRTQRLLPSHIAIAGDVLEHMSRDEAVWLWQEMRRTSKYVIGSVPRGEYPQGPHDGNPYEEHKATYEGGWDVRATFKGVDAVYEGDVVTVFTAKGLRE